MAVPVIEQHTPKDFGELLEIIGQNHVGKETVWYRGVNNSCHSLIPSIARSRSVKKESDIAALERKIINSFIQRSPPFLDRELSGTWRPMFFMQHYGVPTRLLDWSESPFVSLYFSLTNVARSKRGKPETDVALWMCDPIQWNRTSLSHISFKGQVLDESSEEIKAYTPNMEMEQKATHPVMIYGVHNSTRIVAQRGVFALFGKSLIGMEKLYETGDFPEKSLQKIVIQKVYVDSILESLFQKGFSESVIYPDIFGLSLEIRRRFGY